MAKKTVKSALVERSLAQDAAEAEKLVLARRVLLDGQAVHSGGTKISEDQKLEILQGKKYFSRAGEKLEHALRVFEINVDGSVCADVGASTGGFTGVLLDHGAVKVYAIDVARGEIAWKLRTDSRVVLMEKTNARELLSLPEPLDLVSIDVSFISVSRIIPNVKNWLKTDGKVVVLVKPQFEAPRELVEDGGVILSKNTHIQVLRNFRQNVICSNFSITALSRSPINGTEGNREFLALLENQGTDISDQQIDEVVNS